MIIKHETITRELTAEIARMNFGDRLQTVRELAERFAVSTRTMNKALKPLFSRGLITADGTRGCYVSAKRRERSGIVGVYAPISQILIEDDPLLSPLQDLIIKDGFKPLFSNVPDATVFDNERFWCSNCLDGYLFVYSTFNRQLSGWLKNAEIPFVAANRLPENYCGSWCDFKHAPVIHEIVGSLLAKGFRRIAFYNVPSFSNSVENSNRIWEEVMDHFHIPEADRFMVQGVLAAGTNPQQSDADRHMEYFFGGDNRPEVIILSNTRVNDLFCNAIKKLGIRIPEDVKVLEFNDGNPTSCIDVKHISGANKVDMVLPYEKLAGELWRIFKKQLKNPGQPPEYVELDYDFKLNWS